jgi:hypothetical protein
MNERILKLIEQSKCLSDGYNTGAVDLEKFAELMIKKFDGILLLEYIDCVGEQDKQAADRIARLRGKVEAYFGVEL